MEATSHTTKVTEIGSCFCRACTSLETIDLSALHRVVKAGNDFLWRCTSLGSIDLSAFGSTTSVGFGFIIDCSSLKTVDLSVLRGLINIIHVWMRSSTQRRIFPSGVFYFFFGGGVFKTRVLGCNPNEQDKTKKLAFLLSNRFYSPTRTQNVNTTLNQK